MQGRYTLANFQMQGKYTKVIALHLKNLLRCVVSLFTENVCYLDNIFSLIVLALFSLVVLALLLTNAPLHQAENIFKVSQKLVCEK